KKLGLQFTQVSYILIILLGMYLLYSLIYRKWKSRQTHSEHHHHNHTHSHSHDHDHTHNHHHSHEHHTHDHHDECGCGHSHIPSAHEVQGKWDIAKIISLVLSVGLRPCTGALYVLALALIKGVFWVGVVSVYAMALGTAITISLVTMAVVGGRQVAFVTSSGNSRFGNYLYDVCTMGGAIVIILFGSLLLSSSFTPITPF
ncbi:MAG: delayed-early response protein/equilibrative nucleoside transporter, partial [Rhizobiales bacterium]|nr:delayed-early response protein/equilibrative nucleoside transporter [Hyphomicrobiales bacterium]